MCRSVFATSINADEEAPSKTSMEENQIFSPQNFMVFFICMEILLFLHLLSYQTGLQRHKNTTVSTVFHSALRW